MLTAFDRKVNELCRLQKEVTGHLARLNALRSRYMDWFNRKHQSFLDAVKAVQVSMPQLLPKHITCIRHYRATLEMAKKISTNGKARMGLVDKMEEYLGFWGALLALKEENDVVYDKIDKFCRSIQRLRDPEIKDQVDNLKSKLSLAFSEDWDFTSVNNEKDNLFTYKISTQDQEFLGLVGYIPYLLTFATKVCYFCGKLHVEKE